MDGQLNPTIEDKIKIRKTLQPVIGELIEEIRSLKDEIKKINAPTVNVSTPDIQKVEVLNQLETKDIQKVEVINQTTVEIPDIQKVEVINQEKLPEIKFPEIQKVSVDNLIDTMTIENLPIGNGSEASVKKANPSNYIIVRLTDGKQFISPTASVSSSGTTRPGDHFFLREEYTYATISGIEVATKIEKWSDNIKVTENYEYDGNANPIKKFRSIEPI